MSESPAVVGSISAENTKMDLDSQTNGDANGHVQEPVTSKPSVPVAINGQANGDGEDVVMDDAHDIPNGKAVEGGVDAEESVAPAVSVVEPKPQPERVASAEPIIPEDPTIDTAPIQETDAVPPPIEQPTSDVRDEPVSLEPTTTAAELSPEPMVVDENPIDNQQAETINPLDNPAEAPNGDKEEQAEIPKPQSSAKPQSSSNTLVAGQSLEMRMPRAAGQVRPRDDDEDNEPDAKRAKTTPDVTGSANVSGDTATAGAATEDAETNASVMAPPPGPTVPLQFDTNQMTKAQHRFLLDSLRKTKKTKAALPFLSPVDHVSLGLPTYPDVIKNPMDISTVEEKLKKEAYASANDFWQDMDLMVQNALTFNGPTHAVSYSGVNLRQYFAKLMQTLPTGDGSHDAQKKKAQPPTKTMPPRRESRTAAMAKVNPPTNPSPPTGTPAPKAVTPKAKPDPPKRQESYVDANGVPAIRRDSESSRPKREIIKPPSKDLVYTSVTNKDRKRKQPRLELEFCEEVIKELKKAKISAHSHYFMSAVDTVALNIPHYNKIVKKPMDFGTIDKKLQDGAYKNAKEFHADAELVFKNCFLFNAPGDLVHTAGQKTQEAFEQAWTKKDEWIANNQPPSEPPSDADSDEESEESEGEGKDEQLRRMMDLQKQIAALSAEVISLSSAHTQSKGKKKDKKVKVEGSKKTKRGSTSLGALTQKTSTKTKKPPKPKRLSLEQKRYVSDGIADLDEANMRKAVQMIRNGVPKLRDVHDDELELDVDEIPDHVLHDLLKFVKNYRRNTGTDVAEDEDYEESALPKQHSTTQRKKSKPMSAREQESKIAQVKQQLQRFDNQSGSENGNNDGKRQAISSAQNQASRLDIGTASAGGNVNVNGNSVSPHRMLGGGRSGYDRAAFSSASIPMASKPVIGNFTVLSALLGLSFCPPCCKFQS
ncbi:Bromodomain-containing protein [Microthyrium microscopicum]|uniref:Bromodomain-containing protein n=1 Tax=Microthyrium microscopicum TaxID=703497 RepID=A0A6A6U7N8_9PEZI|nr:Bromodomain-containing protein [Microthyrium microscopicum]